MPGIEFAIKNFDYHAARGAIPKNWRSKLSLKDARFGDVTRSIPALVFGSWERARTVGGYKWAGSLIEHGCIATKFISTAELRRVWEATLNTDPIWSYQRGTYFRMIKGITFTINMDVFGNGVTLGYGTELKNYRNISSAKRAVRKLIQRGEI